MMSSKHIASVVSLGAVFLTSCSVLPKPAPADTIYRLGAFPEAVAASQDATVIRVDRPGAPLVFQTRDVVVSPDGQRLASAAQAKWAETMPTLVQTALVDVFSTTPNLIGVLPASGARADRRVQLTIKNFEAQFDNGPDAAPLAVVRYTVTYANASNRALLGTYEVKKTQRARARNVSQIVQAISDANEAALIDITNWLERENNA